MTKQERRRLIVNRIKINQFNKPLRKRLKKVPRALFPLAIERAYGKELKDLVIKLSAQVKEQLISQLQYIKEVSTAEKKMDASSGKLISIALNGLRLSAAEIFNDRAVQDIALKYGERTSDFQRTQMKKQFETVLGVNPLLSEPYLAAQMEKFTEANIALIRTIPDQMLSKVETLVRTGVETGIGTDELSDQIYNQFDVTENRADLIARDQIGKFNSSLNQLRQQEVGVEKYVWSTAGDDRVRDEHAELEGQIFTWDEGDSEGNLPGQAVNCFTSDNLISFTSKPLKIYKRLYTGSIVKITDETAVSITVTPNHPILTSRGWVFAKDIQKSDKLIKSLLSDVFNIFDTKIDDNHIIITDDIYDFLKVVFLSKRITGREVKFHGDITNQEVEIISLESMLPNNIEPFRYQKIIDKLFTFANPTKSPLHTDSHFLTLFESLLNTFDRKMSIPDLVSPLFGSHSAPLIFFRLALISDFDTLFDKSSSNDVPRSLKLFRDLVLTYSRIIKTDNFSDIKIYSINGMPFVETGIIDISHYETSESVFNFETEDSLYMCNGIVNHNCRCVAIPVMDIFAEEADA